MPEAVAPVTVVDVVVAGIGGQGVVKASDIVADAAFRAGYDVKKAEVHGMSQRGGSVSADVRFGARVLSPMVPPGEAAFLVVVAADQVEVHRARLAPGGVLIAPADLGDARLPHPRSLNVALLGMLSTHLAIPEEHWIAAIHAALASKLHPVNDVAFALGQRVARDRAPGDRDG
jgi:indolepyruvate ferredoxin oxidoreductase, beta subunit